MLSGTQVAKGSLIPDRTSVSYRKMSYWENIFEHLENCRSDSNRQLCRSERQNMGQFFTPVPIARFIASLVTDESVDGDVVLLDPGAGIGTLSAACVDTWCRSDVRPKSISVVAYEVEPVLVEYLRETLEKCDLMCRSRGIRFDSHIIERDFIEDAVSSLENSLFTIECRKFTHVVMNPPYRKINSRSRVRKILRKANIQTSNLYTAFMWLGIKLLKQDGVFVSITPRSFCNGIYFQGFRQYLSNDVSIRRLHTFHSRSDMFREDNVLQENLILSATKVETQSSRVTVSSSWGGTDEIESRTVPLNR